VSIFVGCGQSDGLGAVCQIVRALLQFPPLSQSKSESLGRWYNNFSLIRLERARNEIGSRDQSSWRSTSSASLIWAWGKFGAEKSSSASERARLLGGKCRIKSKPGRGTAILVELPLS
jgi:hypothetical protein